VTWYFLTLNKFIDNFNLDLRISRLLPSHRQVIDGNLTQILLIVDDEESAERNSRLLVEHAVITGDLEVFVREQRNVHFAETALFAGRVDPRKMTEVGICRYSDHLAADIVEFLYAIGESNDLSRANESATTKREHMKCIKYNDDNYTMRSYYSK